LTVPQPRPRAAASLRAVLFDFDGTLIDGYAGITASVNHVRAGYGLPPLPEEKVRRHVGRGALYLLQHTVPEGDAEKDIASYRDHHPSVLRSGTRLLPGAREALGEAKRSGLLVGICSNKPVAFTRELLDYLELAGSVDVVLGPEDVARPKPAPDMLREALARLGVSPGEALYVGDMTVDVETGQGAGVAVWVVPTGSHGRETLRAAKPDLLLRDIHEFRIALGRSAQSRGSFP
jgi:phosphoglycolate phosphatase